MKICMLICSMLCILLVDNISAQDTIWFLSGERLITSNYTIKTEDGMLNYFNKRNKEKHIGLEYIYSVNEKTGYKKIYYEPSIMDNTPFSVAQMGSFIKGEFEAHNNYHAAGSTLIGIGTGIGGVYLFPALGTSVFYSPLVPAVGSAINGMTNVSDKKIGKKCPQYADNEYFIAGYREIANQKRVSNSIKGGILGLAIGIASAIILYR
jgi:hypothetical protein